MTQRQQYVLDNYKGKRMADIANELNVSVATVKYDVRKLRDNGYNLPRKIAAPKKKKEKVYIAAKRAAKKPLKTKEIDMAGKRWVKRDNRTWVLVAA